MKLTLCIILISVYGAVASLSYSQTANTFSFELENVTVRTALERIENQSKYYFLYSEKMINVDRKININLVECTIDDILAKIFEGTNVTYTLKDRQIVLSTDDSPFVSNISQQPLTISGMVADQSSQPLPGVTVVVKGTTQGTISDTDGNYSLANVPADATLVFSFVGMKTQEIRVARKTKIDVVMTESTIGLDEVVAIGYGTQKKENLTGSVSSINMDNEVIQSRTITNLSTALAGMSSGIRVQQSNGLPREGGATIQIRGVGSLNASQTPLVIIDGQPGDLNSVSSSDVASISVLKDAASAAIYGSRASNGVILVTTKSGSDTGGKITFKYDGYMGMSSPLQLDDVISNTADHMGLVNQILINSGLAEEFTQAQITEWREKSKTDPIGYPNTDWWDALIKNNTVQNHQISARGGNEQINFYSSVNLYNNDGLISNSGYKRITFRNNLSYKVNEWLELGNILTLMAGKADPMQLGDAFSYWYISTPGIVPKHPDGRYGSDQLPTLASPNNRLWAIERKLGEINSRNYSAKLFAVISPVKGLKVTGSYFLNRSDEDNWSSQKPMDRWNFQTETIGYDGTTGAVTSVNQYYGKTERQVFDLFADYNCSLGQHTIHLLAGYNQEYYKDTWFSANKKDLLSLDIPVLNTASGEARADGSATDFALRSYFGRFNYNYKEKYLLEANLRNDGSSRFSPDNRWGLFPSFSAAWRISEENFWFSDNSIFDDAKIRISWGQLGNNGIDNYEWQNFYVKRNYSLNGQAIPTIAYTALGNDQITWETTNSLNIGADLRFFKNKFVATFDYYNKLTKNILANEPIPYVNGIVTAPRVNSAEVRNSGVELELQYNTNLKGWSLSMGGQVSYNKNRIEKYKGDYYEPHDYGVWTEGQPVGIYWLREVDHIITEQSEVDALVADGWTFSPSTPTVGDFLYKNTNDDKVINDDDRVLMGNPIPLYNYSANLSAKYKGFDFYLLLSGVAKWDKYLHSPLYSLDRQLNMLLPKSYLNSWSENNSDTQIPKIYTSNPRNDQESEFFLHKADYLRFKTIQLGYSLPGALTQRAKLNKVRVFMNLENFFTITSYPGQDPETSPSMEPTMGLTTYPSIKTISFGLNLGF